MDPTDDCVIKLDTPIRSQEKYSFIIFKFPEEYGDQTIVSIMVRCTLLHKRICFIQQEHGIKVRSDLEYGFKLLLKRTGISMVDNELSCRYLGKSARDSQHHDWLVPNREAA